MDRSLVERARTGDGSAFEELARKVVDEVYQKAFTILGNAADAHDAAQETLIAAWRSIGSLRDASRFDAWLGRILVNQCRMTLRRRRGVRLIRLDPVVHENLRDGRLSLDVVAADADRFDRAFERLPVDQRVLLIEHHLEERPLAEVAGRLGIPIGTAKSRLHAARIALDRALEAER